jgi:hypothetical protein
MQKLTIERPRTETAAAALVGAASEPSAKKKPADHGRDKRKRDVALPRVPPAETLTPRLTTTPTTEDDDSDGNVDLPADAEPLISRHSAAIWLNICDDQVSRLVARGELDGIKMGGATGARLKIVPASVRALIARRQRRKVGMELPPAA